VQLLLSLKPLQMCRHPASLMCCAHHACPSQDVPLTSLVRGGMYVCSFSTAATTGMYVLYAVYLQSIGIRKPAYMDYHSKITWTRTSHCFTWFQLLCAACCCDGERQIPRAVYTGK
jgi:hypothetical protein